jgi:hypothetical protein
LSALKDVEVDASSSLLNINATTVDAAAHHDDDIINGAQHHQQQPAATTLLQGIIDKIGKIDDSRYRSTSSKLFSNVSDQQAEDNDSNTVNVTTSSIISSSFLLTGTALGSSLLTLPTAISSAGYDVGVLEDARSSEWRRCTSSQHSSLGTQPFHFVR